MPRGREGEIGTADCSDPVQWTAIIPIDWANWSQGHSLAMLRRIAAALDKRVEMCFLPDKRKPTSA